MKIALPTVILFTGTYSTWLYTLWHASFDFTTVATLSVCTFILFTPMHDAVHDAISKNIIINDVIGQLCATSFVAPFIIFKYVHLTHHKKLNIPDADPDNWSGLSYPILRWITQDYYYYYWYLSRKEKRPTSEIIELVIWLMFYICFIYFNPMWTLKFIILPGRIAATLLAFTFDYLPHRPHLSRNRYEATTMVSLYSNKLWPLSPFFLYQNYHAIHHLYPHVPFYEYSKVWENEKHKLMARGVRYNPVLG